MSLSSVCPVGVRMGGSGRRAVGRRGAEFSTAAWTPQARAKRSAGVTFQVRHFTWVSQASAGRSLADAVDLHSRWCQA
jgi:hypothetical protein